MDLKSILPLPRGNDKKLGEADLNLYNEVSFSDNIKKEIPAIDSKLNLNIESSSKINSYIINGIDDIEAANLENFYLSEEELSKVIERKAIVIHSLTGRLNATGGIPIKEILQFDLGMRKEIQLNWYKPYENHLTVKEALLDDLSNFKSLVTNGNEIGFWESREINEAFSYIYDGEIDFSVEVNLVQLLSVVFAPVFSLCKSGVKVPLEINPSLSVKVEASKKDVFECLIQKKNVDDFRIRINKKKIASNQLSLGASLSISLLQSDKEILTDLIDQYFQDYLGNTISGIDAILNKYESYKEDNFILKLVEKIKYVGDSIEGLKLHYQEYKLKVESAKEAVLKLVQQTVKIGLDCSFKKVVETGTFLDADISLNLLKKHLKEILILDIRPLIEKAKSGSEDISVNSYFNEKSITFERNFSFGLSIGNWALQSSNEEVYSIDKKFHDFNDKRTVSIAYLFNKEITNGKEKLKYEVSMASESNVPDDDITYDELDNTLSLIATKFDNKVRKHEVKDLNAFITTAVCWGIIDGNAGADYKDELWEKVFKTGEVTYETKISISNALFTNVLSALDDYMNEETIARAMAIAILPTKKIEESNNMSDRINFYSKIILNSFRHIGTLESITSGAYPSSYKRWANKLSDDIHDEKSRFIAGVTIPKMKEVQSLVSAVKVFNNYITEGKPLENHQDRKSRTAINLFFKELKNISKDRTGFSQRWFGQLLVASVKESEAELLDEISKTFSVRYQEKGVEKVMLFGA